MISDPPIYLAGNGLPRVVGARRLRVLQVIDSLTLGGAEQLLVTLARNIDAANYDLRVCSLAPLDETSLVVRDLRALGTPLYAVSHRGEPRHHPRQILRLIGLVRGLDIDVLHTHLGYGNVVGALAGVMARRPVVATLHNAHYVPTWSGRLKQTLRSQTLRWCARTIIACAPEVREAALTRLGLPAGKLVDVPNGIDTEAYAEANRASAACRATLLECASGPLVIAVGNLRPAKGHENLLDAVARLRVRWPGLRLVIVGRGGAHEAALRAHAASLHLDGCLTLLGERRDVAALLHAADVFVQPSVFEGLPLALLEAMAAGVPVLATAVGGVPRVVEDGVTGRLVPPGNADALAQALLDLLDQPERARRLAAAAQERVQRVYGAASWARRLQDIYTKAGGR